VKGLSIRFRVAAAPPIVAAALLLTACASDEPLIREAYGRADSPRLELSVNSCNRNPRAAAEESDTEVRITITLDEADGDAGGDCSDSAKVTLAQPLGARAVIDTASGDAVRVLPSEQGS
jgi:uncharacterized lipoprotein YmbA